MKTSAQFTHAQLTHALLAAAVVATGLTAVAAVAGPLPMASAAVSPTSKVVAVQRAASVGAFLTQGGDVYTWGENVSGGTGPGRHRASPRRR